VLLKGNPSVIATANIAVSRTCQAASPVPVRRWIDLI
jgi:hypothetical protein